MNQDPLFDRNRLAYLLSELTDGSAAPEVMAELQRRTAQGGHAEKTGRSKS